MGFTLAVLITYHNEGSFLTECLESLRQGGRLPDQILVYDDCSTIAPHPYIPAEMPVRVIRGTRNVGPALGRNVLLEASDCQYIHFHDADDLFARGWYDEVRARLESNELDAVFTEFASFQDGQPKSESTKTDLSELASNVDLVRFCMTRGLPPATGTYRRERVAAIGGYSGKYWQSEDYDFHIRLAAAGLRFSVILRPLIWQRVHPNNRSKDNVRVWTDAVQILDALAPELPPRYLQDVCDAMGRAGRILHQIGAISEARDAFVLASRLGHPRFPGASPFYRLVARSFGPTFAERIGGAYRLLLPGRVRARLRDLRLNA